MPEITIGGNRINYIEGDVTDPARPTVLLIHGAGQRIATWKPQLELLKDDPRYNVIAPDLPGHGASEGTGYRDIESYKGFIDEFTTALGLSDLIPVGHSMGGAVAMVFALDHPEKIRASVLAGTGARMRVSAETLKTVKNDYKAFCDVAPGRMFAPDSPAELKEKFRKDLLGTSSEVCYWDLVACDEFDIMDRVHEITRPVCVISADLDILTPTKYGEYLNSSIRGSSYHVINGSGHFMMLERPLEFNEILTGFLMSVEP
ncbi:MAG: alpha/beta hydrolase [Thermodesulfobacteriota bacterium]